jgi:Phytanoyl-CoA dioxygenase (PhyH)
MNTISFDSTASDGVRRKRLYEGQLFVFSPRPASVALCEFARGMIEEAFGAIDPRRAQYSMPVEEYVAIVAPLKPAFIHHPETKQLLRAVVEDLGCDLAKTYVDVPRLRMVTHGGCLTSGVGYAHHPHRDTWYSAPMCQLNWWLPIYDIESESSMAFHPHYRSKPVENSSGDFNYYEWNANGRKNAAQHVKTDTHKQPHALEPMELQPEIRVVCPPGGIILFSAAQMHSTVPNTSGSARYSIDFRTAHLEDVINNEGAPNIDSSPVGTSLRDFQRGADLAPIPEELVRRYDNSPVPEASAVFRP